MDEKKLQQQIVQLVQAAMQGNKKAQQRVQQIMQAAQQGDQQAAQIAQMIQAVAKQMQNQQVQAAKFGAKLNYIRQLNGKCPDGYEMQYFKQGGKVCKKCVAKQSQNPVDSFRCGRKVSKNQQGNKIDFRYGKDPNGMLNYKNQDNIRYYKNPFTKYRMEIYTKPYKDDVTGIQSDTTLYDPNGRVYRTITDDPEFKNKFDLSGFARANSIKKKTKVSKNQQGGSIPIEWVRNAITAIANIPNYLASGGNKIVGAIGRLVSPDIEDSIYHQWKVSKPYPGQVTSFEYIDKKPITGLRRYINHVYLPDGSSYSDTTYQSLSDHHNWSWNNKLFPEQRKKFENMKRRYGD